MYPLGHVSIGTRRFVRRVDPGFLEMFLGSRLIGHTLLFAVLLCIREQHKSRRAATQE
jgi:hypothetical protein